MPNKLEKLVKTINNANGEYEMGSCTLGRALYAEADKLERHLLNELRRGWDARVSDLHSAMCSFEAVYEFELREDEKHMSHVAEDRVAPSLRRYSRAFDRASKLTNPYERK